MAVNSYGKNTSKQRGNKASSRSVKTVATKESYSSKETLAEKGPRIYRNFNIAVGSLALAGALVTPPGIAAGLGVYAAFNFAQAAAGEGVLRYVRGRKKKKTRSKRISQN